MMQVEQNSTKFSNPFNALANVNDYHEKIDNTTTLIDGSFNQQIIPISSSKKGGRTSNNLAKFSGDRQNAINSNVAEVSKGELLPRSSTPTILVSSPQVQKIIKESQIEMMMYANPIFKQPLVTLNTSAYDIPSQSVESFGDFEGESGQLMLSTGNNNEVIQSNLRLMAIKSKLWQEQREDDNEEDWGDGFAGYSSEEADNEVDRDSKVYEVC